jgi:EAL and modified HD-GYP domain-containing signal transduction protein
MNDATSEIFVARQPIFSPNQSLYGYELLYRNSMSNAYQATDATAATLDVMKGAFLVLGPQLTGSKKAFINFNRELLEKRSAFSLHPQSTVIEILEDVRADDTMVDICRELKNAGYTIALDDFDERNNKLVDLADIIKVDFRATAPRERKQLVTGNRRRKITFLAEKVETIDEFEEAKEIGYSYFQGYFFSKPVIVSARTIPSTKVNYVRMLSEINRPELDFLTLEKTIMQDTYLTYTLLNYMNSAYFGFRDQVTSIRQALVFLGERELRKWASLVILTFVGADRPSEVVTTSLIRAKFCEQFTSLRELAANGSELFMIGMFSMLDVMIGRPLDEILTTINVSNQVKTALGPGGNMHGDVLRLVLAYEKGDWDGFAQWSEKLGIDRNLIPLMYYKSVEWADKVLQSQAVTEARKASA